MHQHGDSCGCGAHQHECDHSNHHHEHNEHCGCGHEHVPMPSPEGLSPVQVDILLELRQRKCLPVACFSLAKADDERRYGVALAPVYLGTPEDSMDRVKEIGKELSLLEGMELLTLDYDIPLKDYNYEEYKTSGLYAYFVKTVEKTARQPDATFDTPTLELGSMALTETGEKLVDGLFQSCDA